MNSKIANSALAALVAAGILLAGCGEDAYVKAVSDGVCLLDENGCPIDANDPDCVGPWPEACGLDNYYEINNTVIQEVAPECEINATTGCPVDMADEKCTDYYPIHCIIPEGMEITTLDPVHYLTAICKNNSKGWPEVKGIIDNDINGDNDPDADGENWITVPLDYILTGTDQGTIGKYIVTKEIPSSLSQTGESGVKLSLYWDKQKAYPSGTIMGKILVDDGKSTQDFEAMCKDIDDDYEGYELAKFPYPIKPGNMETNETETSNFTIRVSAYVTNTNGGDPEIFIPVPDGKGKLWLNFDLGAPYANPSDPAFQPDAIPTSTTDANAIGSFWQWGRKADGHQLTKVETVSNTLLHTGLYGTTSTKDDEPNDNLFITSTGDWRVNADDTLWKGVSAPNKVCPAGYRIPTFPEWEEAGQGVTSAGVAWLPPEFLNLQLGGFRDAATGAGQSLPSTAYFWSSTPTTNNQMYVYKFEEDNTIAGGVKATKTQTIKAQGNPVRCRKDYPIYTN